MRSAYWLLSGAGLAYLGFDERISLHERIGDWTERHIGGPPPHVHRNDDLVLLAFGIAGLAVTARFWREVVAHPTVFALIVAGCASTAVSIAVDLFGPREGFLPWFEERLEFVGQVLFFAAVLREWQLTRAPAAEEVPRVAEELPGAT
ncbi:MAG: hypothetical protein ACM3S1_07055 [Hyphomicrobiales bacterium]